MDKKDIIRSQTVFINSRNRNVGTLTNACFNFPSGLLACDSSNGENMRFALHSFSIFNTVANVNRTNNQIGFNFDPSAGASPFNLTIPVGNYKVSALVNYVQTQYNTVAPAAYRDLVLTFNQTTNKFTFVFSTGVGRQIYFPAGFEEGAKQLWGFTTSIKPQPLTYAAVFESDVAMIPRTINEVYIRLSGVTSINSQNMDNLQISKPMQLSNTFACIPLNPRSFEMTHWRPYSTYEYNIIVKDREITQLRIQLVDKFGNELNDILTGDWLMALKVDTLRKVEHQYFFVQQPPLREEAAMEDAPASVDPSVLFPM